MPRPPISEKLQLGHVQLDILETLRDHPGLSYAALADWLGAKVCNLYGPVRVLRSHLLISARDCPREGRPADEEGKVYVRLYLNEAGRQALQDRLDKGRVPGVKSNRRKRS